MTDKKVCDACDNTSNDYHKCPMRAMIRRIHYNLDSGATLVFALNFGCWEYWQPRREDDR